MIDEVLRKLIEFLQEASPLVWQTLVKQVYVEAFSKFAWGALLLVGAFFLVKFAAKLKATYEEEYPDGRWAEDSVAGFVYLMSLFVGVAGFAFVISALKWVANPEYYAIRLILSNIGGG